MHNVRFQYLDTEDFANYLPQLFHILHSNMSVIAPTNHSYEEDYTFWVSSIYPSMQDDSRKTVLIYSDKRLIGFFRFYINCDALSLLMEDIQIILEFQGSGFFSLLFKWLVKELPQSIVTVEAYANKQNVKSIAVLEHLGLKRVGENKTGNSFRYKGKYSFLFDKYS